MSDQAAAGSRGEWPLKQRGRNSGAVRLCGLDLADGMLTLDCEPCGRHGRYRLKTLIEVYGPRARASRHTARPRIQGRMPWLQQSAAAMSCALQGSS